MGAQKILRLMERAHEVGDTGGGDLGKSPGRGHSHPKALHLQIHLPKILRASSTFPAQNPFHSPSLPSHCLWKKVHTSYPGIWCHTPWVPPNRSTHCFPNDFLPPIFQHFCSCCSPTWLSPLFLLWKACPSSKAWQKPFLFYEGVTATWENSLVFVPKIWMEGLLDAHKCSRHLE